MSNRKDTSWKNLEGQQVQVYKDGDVFRTGYVEEVTFSGDALWLQAYGAYQRVLLCRADGYHIIAMPETPREQEC
ncbi:hypothetical protein ACHMXB_21980 (plasmid) [Arthrobacter sp. UC242_113]|uniref:hypothetical protein n=1 Tax=Arthrobacter sp. UC242_113 TaxID=3374550 RepID=UPI003757305D